VRDLAIYRKLRLHIDRTLDRYRREAGTPNASAAFG
jgi:hypothetical protein